MSSETVKVGVGSTVWIFDLNRRIYTKPDKGHIWTGSRIIYREHWRPKVITSETKQSFILGNYFDRKLAKKDLKMPFGKRYRQWAISLEEVDADCWDQDHRVDVADMVRECDVATLRKIAELVGYKEPS